MFDSARGQDLRVVKPINYRPILFCALSLIAGVLLYRYYPVMGVWTVLTPLFVLCLICALLFLVVDKKTRPTVVITCLFCFIFAIIGMVSFDLKLKSMTKGNVEDGAYVVVGEVKDVTYKDGVYCATLSNCTYNGEQGSDLYVYGLSSKVSLYDVLEINCEVKSNKIEKGKPISNSILSGRAISVVRLYSFNIIGKSDSVASKFKVETDENFKRVLGEDFGILSALLRGDDSEMRETVNTFRLVGIAHIFAVSGLHIGLIFTALSFIFKKLKLNRVLTVILVSFALVFYSYLCGFSPSSLRAVIMCICMMLSKLLGQKHDGLNALAVSAIIVLLIDAMDLFAIGFILSFVICLSILVLAPPVKSVLSFMPEEFSSSLAVLFASQAAAFPISIMAFGEFSLVSFFANFLLLPIVSILYYATVIGSVICLILPINEHIALFIPQILTVGIKGIIESISRYPMLITYMNKPVMLCYYSLVLCVSDFVNIPKKAKFSCGVLVLVLLLFVATRSFFGVPA